MKHRPATNTVVLFRLRCIFGACFTESRAAFDLTMLMRYTCRMPSLPTAPSSRLPHTPSICWRHMLESEKGLCSRQARLIAFEIPYTSGANPVFV